MSGSSDPVERQAGSSGGGLIVLALGNPLRGDDGVGPAVLEALERSGRVPDGVELVDGGTPGLETALLLEGRRRAIIVDATDIGRSPGEWKRLSPSDVLRPPGDMPLGGAIHNAGLAEALALGQALAILPLRFTIYGVQPLELGWSTGLSEPVQKAIPAVCAAILDEIQEPDSKEADDDGQDSDC
jgi:hydrogenase maturation protease